MLAVTLLALLAACAADSVVAPAVPVTTDRYVLTATNGQSADINICTPTSCYQTIGDTITLGSDSIALHVFVIRETVRTTGQVKDTPGRFQGRFSEMGSAINLASVSADGMTGTIAIDGMRLRGIYGDSYFYLKL